MSKWGDPRGNQFWAQYQEIKIKKIKGHFAPEVIRGPIHSTAKGETIPDDIVADRLFQFRCGLIKAIHIFSGKTSDVSVYVDGFPNFKLSLDKTEFIFNEDITTPVVDIFYGGYGTRNGRLNNIYFSRLILVFKNENQMKEYWTAIVLPSEPEKRGHSGLAHKQSAPESKPSSGGWPFVAGLIVGSILLD